LRSFFIFSISTLEHKRDNIYTFSFDITTMLITIMPSLVLLAAVSPDNIHPSEELPAGSRKRKEVPAEYDDESPFSPRRLAKKHELDEIEEFSPGKCLPGCSLV
jgi:hypothetical protein